MNIKIIFIICICIFFAYKTYEKLNTPIVRECALTDISRMKLDDDNAYTHVKNSIYNPDAKTYIIYPYYSRKNIYGYAIVYSYDKYETIKTQNTFIPNTIYNAKIDSYCQVEYIYVIPQKRKKRHGSLLLDECKKFATQRNENVNMRIPGKYIHFATSNGFIIDTYNDNDTYDCVFGHENNA